MRSKWIPIAILASAQFVMVLDSSVMNVSISLGLWFTRRLPAGSTMPEPADDRVTQPATTTA